MNTLDLELLRTLVAIVGQESFGAAAVQLGRTQSAVTQQMQRLEEQIGHPLFEKRGRQKRLTEHGERLLVYARQMLAMNDEALRHLQQGRLEGTLRIGAPHDMADTMLPPLLAEVVRSSPKLQLDIHVGRSPFLMESLKRGEIDMAISNRLDADLEGVVLRTSPTVWLCGDGYAHDPARPIPLIMADGPSIFRRLAQEALDAAGVAWLTRYTSSSLIGIRAALRAGLGVTARGVEQLDSGLRMLGPMEGLPPLPDLMYRLYVRNRVINPLTRQVFDQIRTRLHWTGNP
ncbi:MULTISPECIES: LysR substrate-binding domain-containing protein [unclassified Variovorax]|uniref:LysR substrate-binding domain-containing protein n=1 Tax=unclassified Variovorax TaxID=663243 RepID=UPI00076C92E8|nr:MULTISPECIES: LysR substrate-binding domain-containing protein [unclassified Variovorax]KWT83594.1 LysR family transcriptional regulator lrhA [Variovorax sp. WDL1]PNG51694.1 HTH-type transcriptional regulator GltC [Variovorax sp. B2]PNG54042.1 HTH-type transcriptional regulator GltC [Variovorax sp. B4]VTV11513.1 HTH-type transcriptional regulator GltC [Variovorax sp. WDL1]